MSDVKLLRIYTDEAAFHGDRKVFEEVASRARRRLAGATVLQALIGFRRSAHLHRPHVLSRRDLSLVIEIVRSRGPVARVRLQHRRYRRDRADHARVPVEVLLGACRRPRRLTGPVAARRSNRAATWPFLPGSETEMKNYKNDRCPRIAGRRLLAAGREAASSRGTRSEGGMPRSPFARAPDNAGGGTCTIP